MIMLLIIFWFHISLTSMICLLHISHVAKRKMLLFPLEFLIAIFETFFNNQLEWNSPHHFYGGGFWSKKKNIFSIYYAGIYPGKQYLLSNVCLLSCVQLFAIPRTVTHQSTLSMWFSKQEYWRGLLFIPLGDLPNFWDGIHNSCTAGRFFTTQSPMKPPPK